MKKFFAACALLVFSLGAVADALALTPATQQKDPGISANLVFGDVMAVDVNSKQIFVKTDAGSVVIVSVPDGTQILRNPPGEKGINKAVPMAFTEIGVGDRALALGRPSEDSKTMTAPKKIVINTKADIAAKQEAERAEWKARGVVGVVAAVNPETKEITLNTRTPEGPKPVQIAASNEVKFRRYAPDSVKFSDAKESSFQEVKVGDQLRARGERSADGARFTPEEIVTGTFRTSLGTVSAVDAAKNEITIKQVQGNQPLTVVVSRDSMLKRIPAEFAAMMGGGGGGAPGAAPQAGGHGAGGGPQVVVRQQPAGGAAPAGAGAPGAAVPGGGGMMRRMGGDMAEMLERLPSTSLAEMKPGDMIVVSSTVGADPTRVTAIQLVAGVEPIIAMMSRRPGGAGGGTAGAGGAGGAGAPNPFGFGIGQP